jgi:hypothetical protein
MDRMNWPPQHYAEKTNLYATFVLLITQNIKEIKKISNKPDMKLYFAFNFDLQYHYTAESISERLIGIE